MSKYIYLKQLLIVGILTLFFSVHQSFARGNKINGSLTNFQGDTVYLTMLYGGKQYVVDTAVAVHGSFSFNSFYDLQSGVYLVVMPPAKSFLILVDSTIPEFSFTADTKDI